MPAHLYERVDKWTHKPGPLFIIRNHFFLPLLAFTIFCINWIQKYKKYIYFVQLQLKTQKHLYLVALVYFLVYFTFL
jgi:hypothetical protein